MEQSSPKESWKNMLRTRNIQPVFFEKTKDGERVFDISTRLIKDRTIFIDCEIDEEITSQVISLLFLLDREDSEKKINLWINSIGGFASGLFGIYDMMYRIKAPVRTVCMGEACSAAAALLAAGSVGHRYIMPHARVMIHEIQADNFGGSNAEVEIGAKEIRAMNNQVIEMLARHTGHTKAKIKRDIQRDKYMGAQEAVEYGLVDKILPYTKEIPPLIKREIKKKNTDKEKEGDEQEE